MTIDSTKTDAIIGRHGLEARALIGVLLDVQDEYHYLPPEALRQVAERMNLPLIQVFQVASFYKAFSLEPRGEHLITVCMGTACHVRGASLVLDRLETRLNVEAGGTTADRQVTLERVNCLGACALGPIVIVDGEYSSQMTAQKADGLLNRLEKQTEEG
jgi:NADH:ubiquinone oxidoreductase subunit E